MLIEKHETCNTIKLTPGEVSYEGLKGDHVCSTLYLTKDCCSDPIELKLPINFPTNPSITWVEEEDANGNIIYNSLKVRVSDTNVVKINGVDYAPAKGFADIFIDASLLFQGQSTTINPVNLNNILLQAYTVEIEFELAECNNVVKLIIDFGANTLNNYIELINTTVTSLTTTASLGTSLVDGKIVLDPRVIGLLETDVFPDSVYNFLLENRYIDGNSPDKTVTDTIEEASRFLECHTHCQVIDYIIKNPTSNLHMIYESLVYAHNCNFISFKELCELWNYLGLKLGFFTVDPCAEAIASDCNCN